MADLANIIQAAQEEIASLHADAARYVRNKAIFEAAAAQSYYERAQLSHKEQEILLQRARNANRPGVPGGSTPKDAPCRTPGSLPSFS